MTKAVSIALFGEGDKYAQFLPAFLRAHLNLFPISEGWKLWVMTDNRPVGDRYGALIVKAHALGLLEHRVMQPMPLTKAMLWRMVPVFSGLGVEHAFSRDLDACPTPRDRTVCDQFIASGADWHTVHDNLAHAGVMGGLCGFRTATFRAKTGLHSLDALYNFAAQSNSEWATHGTDQHVLNRLSARVNGPVLLEHRFNGWTEGRPGLHRREAGTYGCQAYSAPTPDKGTSKLWPDLAAHADALANHMGAAGYDHEAARVFWDEHGDVNIARAVAECER